MAIREVLQIGHPMLSEKAAPVEPLSIGTEEVQGWIEDMVDTMRDANGAGIAANQVGIPYRIFAVEVGANPRYPYKPKVPLTVVVNPVISFLSDLTFESNEGCLSVPNMRGTVTRNLEVRVQGLDRAGNELDFEVRGYSACTWQHECDHLDGILFPHRVTDPTSFCSWKSFSEYHQEAYAEHVQSLVGKWGA